MNILLLGATGRVGASVIDYALTAKHHITAVVRNPAKIQLKHPDLTVVQGDIQKQDSLAEPMRSGIDVVVNVVGSDVFHPSTVVTDSARVLLAAMRQAGVTCYLGITGVAEMDASGMMGSTTIAIIRRSPIRHAVRDHDGAFALVKASDVNWTLAACPYIKDGQFTGKYTIATKGFPGGFKTISPQDVADFLVKEIDAQRFPRQAVGLWN